MAKEFKVPSRKQSIFKIVKKILTLTKWRNIKVESLSGEVPNRCIFVCNHNAKIGPVAYEVALPVFNVKWGAHEMLGNYRSRRKYLRDIFYMQKHGWRRFRSGFKAAFEAIFSKMFYRGIKVIGTYPDGRSALTIKNSIKVLENDMAIVIFPEDSSKGYFDVMTSFYAGFVKLSEQYYKIHNVDLPIYPVYYHHKSRKMIIGYPIFVQDLIKKGLNKDEIAKVYCDAVNEIYFKNFYKKD